MDIKRNDLIQQLVSKHGYTKKAATDIVDDFTDIVLENLRGGNTVSGALTFWNAKPEAAQIHRRARRWMFLPTGFPASTPAAKCGLR